MTAKGRKTVSLVLGSGGARGLAHIGVINWLNTHGYRIVSIAGTSIGALIGGIYAADRLNQYTSWVLQLQKMDMLRLVDLSFGGGLFKGQRIINVLKDLVGDRNIESLPVSYTAVATELRQQKEVWFSSGSLFDAIRASISIPTVLAPYQYAGGLFADGSLVNPVPIAPTLKDKTDLTVAVDLTAKGKVSPGFKQAFYQANALRRENTELFLKHEQEEYEKQTLSFYGVLTRSLEITQSKITRSQLAVFSPDVLISIPTSACLFYEFHRANEMIDLGYYYANSAFSSECSNGLMPTINNSQEYLL